MFWHIIVHSILLWVFAFLRYWILCLHFHFLFCLFGLSLFFLVILARGLSSCLPFQRASSRFYWFFFYYFLKKNLCFIYFLSDIYYLLPLGFVYSSFWGQTDFRFCLFFFYQFFQVVDQFVYLRFFFFFFWWNPVLLWTSLSGWLLLHPTDFVWLCSYCNLSQGVFWFPLWFNHLPSWFVTSM